MKHLIRSLAVIGAALVSFLCAAPAANAQATRTWVSGVGDDANPCSRTAPCKTFAGAISKTAVNGEINCLDPGGFGAVTIIKSITIDCHEIFASILVAGTNAITIPFDSFGGTDVRKTVRLRNLNLNGADTGLRGIQITGASNSANSKIFIEDCLIDGFFGSPGRGIEDTRSNGGKLFISNTTVRNVGAGGIFIAPTAATQLAITVDNVRVENAGGSAIAILAASRAMIFRSVFSGSNIGIDVESASSEVMVNSSTVSNNTTGLFQSVGVLRISNTNVVLNTTGVSGTVQSFTNNMISDNGAGGTITPIGVVTNPTGLQ